MKTPLTPTEYRDALKSGVSGGWLFFGDEAYLKHHALEQTRTAILGEQGTSSLAYRRVDCLELDTERMTDAVVTAPMLGFESDGGKHLTEFHEIQFGALKESEWKELDELFSKLSEQTDTVLIVCTTPEELDAGNLPKAPSKALARLSEYLTPVNFAREDAVKLIRWITRHFSAAGIRPETGACELLLDRVGHDMYALSNEIQKLCAYVGSGSGNRLTVQDVERITCINTDDGGFAFTNALLTRDCDRACAILNGMMLRKEKPTVALSAITRTASELYTVRMLYSAGMSNQDISKKLKMHEYRVKLYVQYAKERTLKKLRSMIDECYRTDIKIKNSSLDEYTLLSRLVVLFAAK